MSETPAEDRPVAPQLKAVVWKGEQFWLGRLVDHPEIMSQGETVEELEANLRDAWRELLLEDVPASYEIRDIAL
jgi:predicted RNase H-like HicB family nuclease